MSHFSLLSLSRSSKCTIIHSSLQSINQSIDQLLVEYEIQCLTHSIANAVPRVQHLRRELAADRLVAALVRAWRSVRCLAAAAAHQWLSIRTHKVARRRALDDHDHVVARAGRAASALVHHKVRDERHGQLQADERECQEAQQRHEARAQRVTVAIRREEATSCMRPARINVSDSRGTRSSRYPSIYPSIHRT